MIAILEFFRLAWYNMSGGFFRRIYIGEDRHLKKIYPR